MKKLIFALTTLFLLLVPINVSADSKAYNITNLSIDAEIKENGDIYVDELFTYKFDGDFNGIYIDLNLKGSEGYDISQVNVIDSNGINPLEMKSDGSNNSYELIENDDKIQVKIFSKSSNEEKKFNLQFTAKNIAEKYKDYSSVYWSFYTASSEYPVSNINLNLKLANTNFSMDDLYYTIFGDGSFTNETTENQISISGEDLTSDLGIKLRFQKDYLNISAIDTYYDEANIGKEEDFELIYLAIPLTLIILIILVFYLVNKRNKRLFNSALEEYRSQYIFSTDEYLLFPPSNESPTIVAYLYEKDDISPSIVPATLLYLANNGIYKLSESLDEANKLESITFIRIMDSSSYKYPHLKFLVNWFEKYENENNEFNLLSIKNDISNDLDKSVAFNDDYFDFINAIEIDCKNLKFFTEIRGKKVLTNEAYQQYLKWKAYKNNLLSLIKNREIFNVKESIIYSSSLGIDYYDLDINKNSKNKSNIYQDDYYYYYYYMNNMLLFDEIKHSSDKIINENSSNSGSDSYSDYSSGSSYSGGGGGGSGAF